jgi:hypothetical protein
MARDVNAGPSRTLKFTAPMTPAERFLERLDGMRPNGANRWTARCPSHTDKNSSLSIRETDDGRVLIHCFGGCATDAVLAAVGLELKDLFTPRAEPFTRRSGSQAPRRDVWQELQPPDLPPDLLASTWAHRQVMLEPFNPGTPEGYANLEMLANWIADALRPAFNPAPTPATVELWQSGTATKDSLWSTQSWNSGTLATRPRGW